MDSASPVASSTAVVEIRRKSSLHNFVSKLRQLKSTSARLPPPQLVPTTVGSRQSPQKPPSPRKSAAGQSSPQKSPKKSHSLASVLKAPPPSKPTIADELFRYEREGFYIPKPWHHHSHGNRNRPVCISQVAVVGENEVEFRMWVGGGDGNPGPRFDVSVECVAGQPWSLTSCTVACSDFSLLDSRYVDELQGIVRLPMLELEPGWLPHYPISVLIFLLLRTLPVTLADLSVTRGCGEELLYHGQRHRRRLTVSTGCASLQGRRPDMEDHFLLQPPWQQIQLFGVFDGHGGANAALRLSQKLPLLFDTYMIDFEREEREVAIGRSLKCSLEAFDRELINNTLESSGSTACVVAVDFKTNMLTTANVGDSRCVLCRLGQAIDLSVDHKADHPYEIARMLAAGGFVSRGRAMGVLAVSRAVGDRDLKKLASGASGGAGGAARCAAIVCDADVDQIALLPSQDEFLLIACDGLFDVMTSQEAVAFARNRLAEGMRPEDAAHALGTFAIDELGSMDNVSIVIIAFSFEPSAAAGILQQHEPDRASLSTPLKSGGGGGGNNNSVLRAARASALKRASSQKRMPAPPQPDFSLPLQPPVMMADLSRVE